MNYTLTSSLIAILAIITTRLSIFNEDHSFKVKYSQESKKPFVIPRENLQSVSSQGSERTLSQADSATLRNQLTELGHMVFVRHQRGNVEAKNYAYQVIAYVKTLGFNAGPQYYAPTGRGRFSVVFDTTRKKPVYLVDVLANSLGN